MNTNQKYVLIFAKDEQGQDSKFRFIVSMNKSFDDLPKTFPRDVLLVEGVDGLAVVGRYTFDLMIGRAFDPDAVLKSVEVVLDHALSNIIRPKLVV